MSDAEREVLKIYEGSRPIEEDLYETSNVNQVAWTLVVIFAGLVLWLAIALVNAETQRFALMSNKCPDPVFKGAIDQECMVKVHSREHWWQHLAFAMTHVSPALPKPPGR